ADRHQSGSVPAGIDLFYLAGGKVANQQLLKMWKRKLHITPWARPLAQANRLIPGWEKHEGPTAYPDGYKRKTLLIGPFIQFKEQEIARGEQCLRNIVGDRKGRIVCVFNRDSSYLDQHEPHRSWTYHDFRDSNVERYVPAMEWLAKKDYLVFRMGAAVQSPLPKNLHENIIDYATLHRSDFMDIILIARCFFSIVTTSGPASLGNTFRKPLAYANAAPFLTTTIFKSNPNELVIPKLYYSELDGRFLSIAEIVESGAARFSNTQEYINAGITLVQNDETDILNLTEEIESVLAGTRSFSADEKESQRRFWIAAGLDPDVAEAYPQPSPSFLKRHQDILFG
ncbi:MAG: TIGR04372 family glycosyltransferase, partial [Nisaea sp.]